MAEQLSETVAASCSARALDAGEPLAGTAVADARWLALEQQGPWPAKLAGALADRCAELGVRLQLLRRSVARDAGDGRVARTCFLAALGDDGRWRVERHVLRDPEDVRRLPLDALGEGRSTDPAARTQEGLFLVCAHGERDPCCARLGRPLHRALCAAHEARTWQTSHLGGHRFAATMVHFPSGYCLGRVPAGRAREIAALLDDARLPVELLRGRVGDPPAAQAADVLVRRERGLDRVGDVALAGVDGGTVTLRVRGGERVTVRVDREPLDAERPASCGKAAEPAERYVVRGLSG